MSAALKRASALLLAAALLAVPASAAGSAGDPLVSRSYAESWGEALAGEAAEAAAQELREVYDAALAAGSVGTRTVSLSDGDAVRLREGASAVLTAGSARVALHAGALVNATVRRRGRQRPLQRRPALHRLRGLRRHHNLQRQQRARRQRRL